MTQPVSADQLRAKAPQPPVDPNISLPKGVREAGERAEVIQRAMTGQAEPSVLNGITPPSQAEAVAPAPEVTSPQVSAPVPPAEVPQAEPEIVPPDEWEKRFRAMKGRFDQQRDQMMQMGDIIQRLQGEMASLRSAAPPAASPDPVSFITDQEVQDYTPEFIDLVRRAAAEVAAPLHAEVQRLQGQLGTVQQETSNAFLTRMNATIGGLVPNWQDINRDPNFIAWVQLPEIYSGVIRQRLMQEAWNNGDAHRVAAFFRSFLAEAAAVDPARVAPHAQPTPPSPTPGVLPNSVQLGTRLSLDQLAAPGRAHSSAQMPADKPVYTAQDITRFYTDVAAGKWRTREQERAAIDADIITAQREGRIIPDQRSIRPMDWNGNR